MAGIAHEVGAIFLFRQKIPGAEESFSKILKFFFGMPIAFVPLRGGVSVASGIWTATSGAAARAQAVDVVANNLANADTMGFKKDELTFKEYLAANEREHLAVDVPRGPVTDKDLNPLDGRDQSFVVVHGTSTNFRPGSLRVTNQQLDMAVDGPGFFEVSTPSGIRFTRHGSFKLSTDGRLVTSEGFPVLTSQPGGMAAQIPNTAQPLANAQPGQGGPETQGGVAAGQGVGARFINLRDAKGRVSISPKGEVFSGETLIGKLSVVEFADTRKLRKDASLTFENPDPSNIQQAERSQIRQGVLETSNVNPVEEMTNLIRANRLFEHDMKAMKTYGDLMQREVNDIGKL